MIESLSDDMVLSLDVFRSRVLKTILVKRTGPESEESE